MNLYQKPEAMEHNKLCCKPWWPSCVPACTCSGVHLLWCQCFLSEQGGGRSKEMELNTMEAFQSRWRVPRQSWGWRGSWLFYLQWMSQGFKLALGRHKRDQAGPSMLWRTLQLPETGSSATVCTRGSHLAIYWCSSHHPEPAAEPSLLCIPVPSSLLVIPCFAVQPAQTFPTHKANWRRSQNGTGLSLFQPLWHPFHVLTNAREMFS